MSKQGRRTAKKVARAHSGGVPVFAIVVGVVIILGLVAVIIAKGNSGSSTAADSRPQFQDVAVKGKSLPSFDPSAATDPAVGTTAPTLVGKNFDGQKVTIGPDGHPQVVAFFAHWCPHCNNEAPKYAAWLKQAGNPPAGIEVYMVPTGTNPSAAHYPPSTWLQQMGLSTYPTLVDSKSDTAANAFGLSSYPYMVFLDKDHKVAGRVSGEGTDYTKAFAALAAGKPVTASDTGGQTTVGG